MTDETIRLRAEILRLREGIAGVRRWAFGLIAGNIEAQKVVDELDYLLAGKPEDKEPKTGGQQV